MRFLTFVQPLIRWINSLPIWRMGRVHVWGRDLRAPNFDRRLCLWLHRVGLMGKADREFLLTHVRPGMTVVDIGANQGLYSLLFAQQVGPDGCVLAFEPDDILHAALVDNLTSNHAHHVTAYHLALGAAPGTMTLYRSLFNSGDNRLAAVGSAERPCDAVLVRVERLDQVLAGRQIDFIKMDVQGWEMEVLRGMEALLDDPSQTNLSIYFEYWPQGLRAAGSDPLEPLEFLSAKGFRVLHTSGGQTRAVEDLPALARSVKTGAYINLYAVRKPPM